jgi:hypothetical protein
MPLKLSQFSDEFWIAIAALTVAVVALIVGSIGVERARLNRDEINDIRAML